MEALFCAPRTKTVPPPFLNPTRAFQVQHITVNLLDRALCFPLFLFVSFSLSLSLSLCLYLSLSLTRLYYGPAGQALKTLPLSRPNLGFQVRPVDGL